jgi:hypothetical protein
MPPQQLTAQAQEAATRFAGYAETLVSEVGALNQQLRRALAADEGSQALELIAAIYQQVSHGQAAMLEIETTMRVKAKRTWEEIAANPFQRQLLQTLAAQADASGRGQTTLRALAEELHARDLHTLYAFLGELRLHGAVEMALMMDPDAPVAYQLRILPPRTVQDRP